MSDLVIIACPPYPELKEAPEDQPHSELFDCPKCKKQMWLSGKKRGAIMFHAVLEKEILLACYDCIRVYASENPEFFSGSEMVNI